MAFLAGGCPPCGEPNQPEPNQPGQDVSEPNAPEPNQPGDGDEPSAPDPCARGAVATGLRVLSSPLGPPAYELHWDLDDPDGFVQALALYEAAPDGVWQLLATLPADARSAPLELHANAGQRSFVVGAITTECASGALSVAYAIDTTSRIAFISNPSGSQFHVFIFAPDGPGEFIDLSGSALDAGYGPSWSPDGRRIAFTANDGTGDALFVVPADGAAPPTKVSGQLPAGLFTRLPLLWSPEGTRIAFQIGRPPRHDMGEYHLYVAAADGSAAPILIGPEAPLDSLAGHYAWSPDGRWLLFESPAQGYRVLVARADGSEPPVELPIPPLDVGAYASSWSPDGTAICYVSIPRSPGHYFHVLVAEWPSMVMRSLAAMPAAFNPRWSPDSSLIAFTAKTTPTSSVNAMMVAPRDGGAPLQINPVVEDTGGVRWGTWSPDGGRIMYTMRPSGGQGHNVWVAETDALTDSRRLTDLAVEDGIEYAVWSKASDAIAFTTGPPRYCDVYTVRLDGSVTLVFDGSPDGQCGTRGPLWAPEGSRLLFAARDSSFRFRAYLHDPALGEPPRLILPFGETSDVHLLAAPWSPMGYAQPER